MNKDNLKIALIAACLMGLSACDQSSSGKSDNGDDNSTTAVDPNAPVVRSKIPQVALRPGDVAEIVVNVDKLPPVEGGGISLRFDPTVIQVDRVELDPAWNFANQLGVIDNTTGEISDILFTSFSSPSGEQKIASLHVTVVAAGTTEIVISESGKNPFAGGGNAVNVVFEDNRLEVN